MNTLNQHDLTDFQPAETVLAVIDMQEKLLPVIAGNEDIADKIRRLIDGANALGVDVIVTEQYPKGLGHTAPEIAEHFLPDTPVIEKTGFSVFREPQFRTILSSKKRRNLIVCGIEADICVMQSCFDAIAAGYRVLVAANAIGSRSTTDRDLALAALRNAGALTVSVDSLLFLMLGDAKNPAFKTISRLVR